MTDPIRDQLDKVWGRLASTNDSQTRTEDIPSLLDALHSVLQLCDGSASFALADSIRRVIAEHLGVTDE